MAGRIDWGVPDWSDETAYPTKANNLTNIQWRWEFLRRRHDYRDAWEAESARVAPIHPKGSPDIPKCRVVLIEDADTLYGLMTICPHPGWDDVTWPNLIFLDAYPKIIAGDIWPEGGALEPFREMLQKDLEAPSATEIAAILDITEPLNPQIKQLKSTVRDYQNLLDRIGSRTGKKVKKQRRLARSGRLLPTYLRVLDANDAGVAMKVIGIGIGKRSDPENARGWAKDALKAAKLIQKQGI
jgi:hypothetical protein